MTAKKPYNLAIFDFDGTLADSRLWVVDVLKELAPRFGFKAINLEEQTQIRGFTSAQFLEYVNLPLWKLPAVMRAVRERARRDARLIPLYPGIPEMLQKLKANGCSLGIVSSNAEDAIRITLKESSGLIDQYSCGASLFGKASKLRLLLRRSKISATEAIYIGDEIRDATAARKSGMAFGAVTWGYNARDALAAQSPDLIFETVPQITASMV